MYFFIIKKPSKYIVFEDFENLQKIIVFEGSRIKNLFEGGKGQNTSKTFSVEGITVENLQKTST